jgi:RNA polymerase sigma-70 factor (ECF subfamily)
LNKYREYYTLSSTGFGVPYALNNRKKAGFTESFRGLYRLTCRFGLMDESELIESLKSGQREGFDALFRLYSRQVYNTCLGLLHHSGDAEDVAQEVFIEIFRSAGNFRGDAKISTWLYRISYNKCMDQLRAKSRNKRSGNVISLDGESAPQIASGNHFEHPGIAIERKEESKIVFAAIAALPENQRAAFTLNKIDGLSYKEVGEIMEMNLPAVESLLHRAKQNLKKLLTDYYSGTK